MGTTQKTTQALVVSDGKPAPSQGTELISLYDSTGAPIDLPQVGSAMLLTGYTSQSAGAVAASDTVNHAIAKLEARIAALEA